MEGVDFLTVFDYIMLGLFVLAILIVLGFALKTKKFFKTLALSCALGIGSLFIMYILSSISGFKLEITPFTLGVSGIFGLPGVICMAVTKMIWFI